jgi:glyoxylase-like metal-dependent hydrolase (beta-lactamase superfamily II)
MLTRRSLLAGAFCGMLPLRFEARAADDAPSLGITALAPGIWRHTSWKLLPNGAPFPSNGLIVRGASGVLIIDTTWPTADMEPLLENVRGLAAGLPVDLVSTHAHSDRMSGVAIARAHGVRTFAFHLSQQDAPGRELPTADETWMDEAKRFDLGGKHVEFFYPGPAHTRDNVVAFIEEDGVLFGGCMLRSARDTDLGNLADAQVAHWQTSIEKVIRQYGPCTRIAVPGHGSPGTADLLTHTHALARAARRSTRGTSGRRLGWARLASSSAPSKSLSPVRSARRTMHTFGGPKFTVA